MYVKRDVKVKTQCFAISDACIGNRPFNNQFLQPPQAVYSQTDYEEYIVMENINQQKINQKNIGSGSSTNINCASNIAGTNLPPSITCPSVPGETPVTPAIPVVTQRGGPFVMARGIGNGQLREIAESRAECLPDEVVTGGGWERIDTHNRVDRGIIKENNEDNAWVVTGSSGSTESPIIFKAYAECLNSSWIPVQHQ